VVLLVEAVVDDVIDLFSFFIDGFTFEGAEVNLYFD